MPLDPARIAAWRYDGLVQAWSRMDAIRYALSLGYGSDPTDPGELAFVLEDRLVASPTLALVVGTPGFWPLDPNSGLDWVNILHGDEGLVLHRPMPPSGAIRADVRVTGLYDKGAGRGALILTERTLRDDASGEPLATVTSTWVCRGDGGFGGEPGPRRVARPVPERAPDARRDLATLPQAALLYRLTGDVNPLHADPETARRAGFERPILHGLCTLGHAGRAVLGEMAGNDPRRLAEIRTRFTAPVYPGETLRTEMWREGDAISFRTRVVERDLVVLDEGFARLR